jgi:putative peptide maturation system protein
MTYRDLDARILNIVAELRALARASAPPATARARIIAAGGPGVDLVHERDPGGASYHFDAILDEPDGAVTVRYCPDRGMPFAVRGAQRMSDRDLVQVDGEVLPVSHAVAMLDFVWSERPVMRRLIDACILQAALRAEPVDLDDGAVQTALDRIRAANGLHSAGDTQRWMAERGMTHEALEAYAEDQAAILALRDRVVGARVAAHFAAHRADHDTATLARVVLPDDARHRALVERVSAERLGLADAIGLAVDAGHVPTHDGTAIARVRRRELTQALRDAVFERAAGRLHVIRDGERLALIHVFAIRPAELDDATFELIAAELFEAWLAERRAAARIEWNWGSADRTWAATSPDREP